MRSMKPHWTPGKVWVFFWDEIGAWVLMKGGRPFLFLTFWQLQFFLNNPATFALMPAGQSSTKELIH